MTTPPSDESPPNENSSPQDTITIQRTWFIAGVVGIVTFLVGGLLGYFLALTAFQRGVDEAVAAVEDAIANAPVAAPQVAAQPTEPPARLDNVSVDDDPALGPEDAPVVIVEFSDFR